MPAGAIRCLTTIVAVDPIYVDFNVDERAMQRYQQLDLAGQDKDKEQPLRERNLPFFFGLDTEKGFPHKGRLVFADNKYTEGTGTILVRGEGKNPDGKLIPGSRVRVRVPVSDKYAATLVPDTAVNTDQDQKYLLVVGEDNIAKRQNVRLGRLLDDGMRVVLEPEAEGRRVDHCRRDGAGEAELSRRADPRVRTGRPPHPPSSLFSTSPVCSQSSHSKDHPQGPFSCYPISSSTGRSLPRCCPSSS